MLASGKDASSPKKMPEKNPAVEKEEAVAYLSYWYI